MGRTPVREALQRLSWERVVSILPRRGIVVAKLGMPEIQETFEARLAVETELARLAAIRHTSEDAVLLSELMTRVEAAAESNDMLDFLAADQKLHHGIATTARNRYLASSADQLLMLSDWLWHQFALRHGTDERPYLRHDVIVEAILDRDQQLAGQAMEDHILRSRALLRDSF